MKQPIRCSGGDANKMASLNATIEVLRGGIAIQKFDQAVKILEVSRKDFAFMIGLNIRSLQRKKTGDHLTPQQSERVLGIIQVLAEGVDYFGNKNTTLEWLRTPNLGLGKKGNHPLQ